MNVTDIFSHQFFDEYEVRITCLNNNTVVDSRGDTCTTSYWYNDNPSYYCGRYDTDIFTASSLCCACGGGYNGDYITTVYQKDVALLKLATSLDIDVYTTTRLPEPGKDYRGKQTTYYGELTFS